MYRSAFLKFVSFDYLSFFHKYFTYLQFFLFFFFLHLSEIVILLDHGMLYRAYLVPLVIYFFFLCLRSYIILNFRILLIVCEPQFEKRWFTCTFSSTMCRYWGIKLNIMLVFAYLIFQINNMKCDSWWNLLHTENYFLPKRPRWNGLAETSSYRFFSWRESSFVVKCPTSYPMSFSSILNNIN